jgi:hypothetical protein
MRFTAFLGELADALSHSGEITRGLATIDRALSQSHGHEEGWCIAELLRIKGEIVLKAGGPKAAGAAEEQFCQSLDRARRQNALSWELRTGMSLARCGRTEIGAPTPAMRWRGRKIASPRDFKPSILKRQKLCSTVRHDSMETGQNQTNNLTFTHAMEPKALAAVGQSGRRQVIELDDVDPTASIRFNDLAH